MVRYGIGLDLGPTSVGWCCVKLDDNGDYAGFLEIPDNDKYIPGLGVRIFEAGVDNMGQGQKEQTKNVPRREKRSMRKMIRRRRGRKLRTLALLQSKGIIPSDEKLLEELYGLDPYEIRYRAVDEKVELEEFGRAIMHIAQRRGFKSNRKQPEKDGEKGKIKEGMRKLEGDKGDRTLGQFWHEKIKSSEGKVPKAIRNKDSYDMMAKREDYESEFEAIWSKQAEHWPEVLNAEFKEKMQEALFFQQRFELSNRNKKKVIGLCSLIPGQLRCSLSNRKAQEFRLLQKINDLKVLEELKYRVLKAGERKELYQALMVKKEMPFVQIRKLLKLPEEALFNLEHEGNKKLVGNAIDSIFAGAKLFGKKWVEFDEVDKQKVWDIFLNSFFVEKNGISAEELVKLYEEEFCVEIKDCSVFERISPPISTVNYSEKALDRLLPFMREGYNLYESEKKAGFEKKWRCLKKLPVPDKASGFQCNNPVVKTTLFQVRKVVNALIREFGKPEYIIIETARDFNAGADRRAEIIKRQKDNQAVREKAKQRIREHFGWEETVPVSSRDLTKYLLWEGQKHLCPYSVKKIEISELLSRDKIVEIDHILPRSMSLDNSMANKVVCFANENQNKGQNTPISWLGEGSTRFEELRGAIETDRFGKDRRKWERFFVKNEDIAENYTPERLLRDTSYIATEVRSFLKRLFPHKIADQKVLTTKGGITAELRHVWELDAILRDGEVGPKNRDDLRHHAVDAAVVAVSKAGMVQKVTRRLQATWPKKPSQAGDIPKPWGSFSSDLFEAIGKVNVSHRVSKRVRGKLHKETVYSKELNGPNKGKFVTTVSLNGITSAQVKKICDERIKELVTERLKEYKGKADKAFEQPLYLPVNKEKEKAGKRKIDGCVPVRRVRIVENSQTMVPIGDNAWCEPGNNHHVEIFRAKVKGKEMLIRRVYTLLEVANNLAGMTGCKDKEKMKKAIVRRENPFPDDPTITDVEFVMSLAIGESVLVDIEGNEVLYRVRKMSYGSNAVSAIDLFLWKDSLAKFDGVPQKGNVDVLRFRNINEIEKYSVKKVVVESLGRVRWAND